MSRLYHRGALIAFTAAAGVSFVMGVLPHPPAIPGEPSDKLLHIVAFVVLGILGPLAFPRLSPLRLWLWLVGFGGLIETVQAIPALNRDSDWIDLAADAAAALVAIALVTAAKRVRKRPRA